jgi:hypothetical protein
VLGELKADVRIVSILSLCLRLGEPKRDDIDFVGLEGSEARALGIDGGRDFFWITLSRLAFEMR